MWFSSHSCGTNSIQLVAAVFASVLLCQQKATTATVTYDFATGDHGWIAGFADYPVDQEAFYELEWGHRPRPAELGGEGAFFISGNNHSDDLFMFLKKELVGLHPNTEYNIAFEIEFASSVPLGLAGVGGPPAESVYVKVGASSIEPNAVVDGSYHRMNIDKGNQSRGGTNMTTVGNIGKSAGMYGDFALVSRMSDANMLTASSDENGRLWLIVGTDSGFEATSSLYYTSISAELSSVPEPSTGILPLGALMALWTCRRILCAS